MSKEFDWEDYQLVCDIDPVLYEKSQRRLMAAIGLIISEVISTGTNNFPKGSAVIAVHPHESITDIPLIAGIVGPAYTIVKKELYKGERSARWFSRRGSIPIDRANPNARFFVSTVREVLNKRESKLVIYASGTRGGAKLQDGAATAARLGGSPIVPVGLFNMTIGARLRSLPLRYPAVAVVGEPFISTRNTRHTTEELGRRLNSLEAEAIGIAESGLQRNLEF